MICFQMPLSRFTICLLSATGALMLFGCDSSTPDAPVDASAVADSAAAHLADSSGDGVGAVDTADGSGGPADVPDTTTDSAPGPADSGVADAPDAAAEDAGSGAWVDVMFGQAADPTGFRGTGSMSLARSAHTATLLADGRVLVVGGESVTTRDPIDSVELFDPATETWATGASLPEPRSNHVAVRLADGRVLVVGGGRSAPIGVPKGEGVLASVVIYDPAADAWETTGDMLEGRSHFGAALLPSGKVLVCGGGAGTHENGSECNGYGITNCGPIGDTLAGAEVFDPATGTFEATAPLAEGRYLFTTTRLADGRVLVVGGANDAKESFRSSEVYDEEAGTWVAGPDLVSADRLFHSAARLPSGRVLVGGGKKSNVTFLSSVDVVDVAAGAAEPTAPLGEALTVGRFVPLTSGHVLSVGGYRCPNPCAPVALAEIYEESTGTWAAIGDLKLPRAAHTATLLADGRVLVAGGYGAFGDLKTCEISE